MGPSIFIVRHLAKRVRSIAETEFTGGARIAEALLETIQGLRVVKALNLEQEMRRRVGEDTMNVERVANKLARVMNRSTPMMETLGGVVVGGVLICGGYSIVVLRIPVSSPGLVRLISLIVVMLLYAGFAYAIYRVRRPEHPLAAKYPAFQPSRSFTWFEYLNPVVLTAGPFNRGSIQKLQVLLFTLLIGGMVLSLVLTLGVLSDLSRTVAMLLGISAIGAAVAQKTTSSNERLEFENWAWLVRKKVLPIAQVETPKWSDLVMTGREFDVYKLQTLIFSAVVAVALWVTGEDRLGSFAVPETLLGILGLSQIAYVAGALVRPPSVPDLDKALTELRELEAKLQLAVAHNVDVDKDGNLPMSLPAPPSPLPPRAQRLSTAANAVSVYKKKADRIEIMLESTLETQVDRKKLEPDIQ
jgi:hypothetical protein